MPFTCPRVVRKFEAIQGNLAEIIYFAEKLRLEKERRTAAGRAGSQQGMWLLCLVKIQKCHANERPFFWEHLIRDFALLLLSQIIPYTHKIASSRLWISYSRLFLIADRTSDRTSNRSAIRHNTGADSANSAGNLISAYPFYSASLERQYLAKSWGSIDADPCRGRSLCRAITQPNLDFLLAGRSADNAPQNPPQITGECQLGLASILLPIVLKDMRWGILTSKNFYNGKLCYYCSCLLRPTLIMQAITFLYYFHHEKEVRLIQALPCSALYSCQTCALWAANCHSPR